MEASSSPLQIEQIHAIMSTVEQGQRKTACITVREKTQNEQKTSNVTESPYVPV